MLSDLDIDLRLRCASDLACAAALLVEGDCGSSGILKDVLLPPPLEVAAIIPGTAEAAVNPVTNAPVPKAEAALAPKAVPIAVNNGITLSLLFEINSPLLSIAALIHTAFPAPI